MVYKIGLKVIAALVVMIVCFAYGYDVGNDRQQAKQIGGLTQAQADSKEVLASQDKSIAIEGRVSESTQQIKAISDEAVKRVESNEPKVITKVVTKYIGIESDSSSTSSEMPNGETVIEITRPWTFDSGTIRLLNSARANDTDSTASSINASDQTPTDITVGKFVENDLEIVSLYHNQSERYQALQDYVKEKQDEGYLFCKPP